MPHNSYIELDFIVVSICDHLSIFDIFSLSRLSRRSYTQIHTKSIKTCVCKSPTQKDALATKFPNWNFFAHLSTQTQFLAWNPSKTVGLKFTHNFPIDFTNFHHLRDLYFVDIPLNIMDQLQHLTKLTFLSFFHNSRPQQLILPSTIQALELNTWTTELTPTMLTALTNLTSLLFCTATITEADLKIHKKTLKKLSIYGNPDQLNIITFSNLPELTHFRSIYGAIQFSKGDDTKNLSFIDSLEIHGLPNVELTGLQYFKNKNIDLDKLKLTSLTKLVYPQLETDHTSADLINLIDLHCDETSFQSFKTAKSLKCLKLLNCSVRSGPIVLSSFTQIEKLSICVKDMTPLFGLSNLTNLDISGFLVKDKRVKFVSGPFPKLVHLRVCYMIVEKKELKTLTGLQSLFIGGCSETISMKDISHMSNLITLKIHEFEYDRDSLGIFFPRLQEFSVRTCHFNYGDLEFSNIKNNRGYYD